MKKITFLLVLMLVFSGVAKSQMVEDFEHIRFNLMLEGGEQDNSSMRVVPNPDVDELENPSNWVAQFNRSQFGVPWGGFWSELPEPIDITENKYVHVRVWKTRISPLRFKIEGGEGGDLEVGSMEPQTVTEGWEDIVFDFSERSGTWPIIAFMPDFEDPLTLTEDIVIYFDHIMINNDPTPGSAPVYVIEDFEMIPMGLMLGGEEDDSYIHVVQNPAMDDVNPSEYVAEFHRSQFGVPWGGFFSALPEPLDLTEDKFVYVKVWKSRISPLHFKVEGGDSDDLEIPSMFPQTLVNEWEEIVFDFSDKTGTWNVIAFMPDFEDPLMLEEDIVIYFDDIRTGSDPTVSTPDLPLAASKVVIYPNPSKGNITVRHSEAITSAEVIDLTGRTVQLLDNLNTKEVNIDLTNQKNGIYIIRVNSATGMSNHKISIF